LKTEKQKVRLRNEIGLHKKCNHPNIVKFVEFIESDIDVCLVLEICDGGELFNRIADKGTFSEKEASRTIKQTCLAVQYLHNMGIVHRDIKPENLLYTSKDENADIKLADFGLAKQLDSQDGRSMLKASLSGTTAYCAPERLNQHQESKAVDMWSIGCILYFLLFGAPPFYSEKEDEDECEGDIIDSVRKCEVKFPENKPISEMAKDLIFRLLEREPGKRITADEVLVHPWIKSHSLPAEHPPILKPSISDNRALLKASINRLIDLQTKDEN